MAQNVARFLLPDPPREDWHLSRLFVNRERELAQARDQIAAMRKDDLGRPMAVVGQARVGKSHLLHQIVRRVARGSDGILAAPDLPRLRQSILMQWVLEDYTSESAARVDPVLLEILQREPPEA